MWDTFLSSLEIAPQLTLAIKLIQINELVRGKHILSSLETAPQLTLAIKLIQTNQLS